MRPRGREARAGVRPGGCPRGGAPGTTRAATYIEERDAVLVHNIRRACQGERGREVVVVLGAAHVNGVKRLLIQSSA